MTDKPLSATGKIQERILDRFFSIKAGTLSDYKGATVISMLAAVAVEIIAVLEDIDQTLDWMNEAQQEKPL